MRGSTNIKSYIDEKFSNTQLMDNEKWAALEKKVNANPDIKTVEEAFSPDKVEAIKKYAADLRRKYPHMKQQRIAKKVAEHFKFKLS